MPDIITRNAPSVEQIWLKELATAVSDPELLLKQLEIDTHAWQSGFNARQLFAMRVPQSFIARMEKGNSNDPLLRQVLPVAQEYVESEGFGPDPLQEQDNPIAGLLHKYKNRVLLITKAGCAINCRYCFRRHFPYQQHQGNKQNWQQAIDYIQSQPEIDEVILSGGDPLMAKDHELAWLVSRLEAITHVKNLRIHSRLAVTLPSRITPSLCELLANSRLNVVLVTHINHPNEIDAAVVAAMQRLKAASVTLLNQSVLLAKINDDVATLKQLSHALFAAGILPYYLHLLDRVQGAAHFLVPDEKAKRLVRELMQEVSGYLVPRLMREQAGKKSKTPIDLHLAD